MLSRDEWNTMQMMSKDKKPVIQSIFLVFLFVFGSGSLDCYEHVILVRSDHDFLLFGLDPQKGQIVGRIEVSDHASGLFGEKGNVLGIVIA